jgi:hypothetical protein
LRILTRDPASKHALALKALNPSNVELVAGTFASEHDLRVGFRGCQLAFVNIDGFNSGEKTETFWTIRAYEIAREEGIEFFVYGNLDYGLKKGGWDSKYRCGHYDGKGRIGEWILSQTHANQGGKSMGAALLTTGPYIEMSISSKTIMTPTVEDGVVTWRVPLGTNGAVPHVALEDCGPYTRWLFDNRSGDANGLDLQVAIAHIKYADLAAAFEKVTGHPARYIPVSMEQYWETGTFANRGNATCGYNSDPKDPASMTVRQNFTGFWNLWRDSGNNQGVVRRDYELLDRIHPSRIRTAEEWFRLEDDKSRKAGLGGLWERVNNLRPVLKDSEDGVRGRL